MNINLEALYPIVGRLVVENALLGDQNERLHAALETRVSVTPEITPASSLGAV